MYNSKLFSVLMILILLSLGATVAFQAMEMNEYQLFETLQTRFAGGK